MVPGRGRSFLTKRHRPTKRRRNSRLRCPSGATNLAFRFVGLFFPVGFTLTPLIGSLEISKAKTHAATPQKKVVSVTQDNANSESKDELKPALPELGTTLCPVCKRRVTVFVTKTKCPFINCGFCAARVFYNGSGAIRRLKRRMQKMKRQNQDPERNRKGKRNE